MERDFEPGTYTKSPGLGGMLQRAIRGGKSGYDFNRDYGSGESVDYGESPSGMYDEEGRPVEWANPNQPQQFDPDARAMPINVNEGMMYGNAYGNIDALIEQNKGPLNAAINRLKDERYDSGQLYNAGRSAIESLRQAEGGDYNLANRETLENMDMINNPGRGIY